jgi:hypothetical protein
MRIIRRLARLTYEHAIAHRLGRPTTGTFWYGEAPPLVTDATSLATYRKAEHPTYPIDYRVRRAYPLATSQGVTKLPYGPPVGTQVNPEAAFQTALGHHTAFVLDQDSAARDAFLSIARFFLWDQADNGDFSYRFDWYENTAPWTSALAQARGACVLARAWRLTSEEAFAAAARSAVSRFGVPVWEGGYLFPFDDGLWFYEEYPARPMRTFNGFLSALIGLYDLALCLEEPNDGPMTRYFVNGVAALEHHGAKFFLPWWTIYDLDRTGGLINVHSPFYHHMVRDYLLVLGVLSGSKVVVDLHRRCVVQDTALHRMRARIQKARRKILVR